MVFMFGRIEIMKAIYIRELIPIMGSLQVIYSDGSVKGYDMIKLGCEWFRMSNDEFHKKYGFNFNPQIYPGLYERCRELVYPKEELFCNPFQLD